MKSPKLSRSSSSNESSFITGSELFVDGGQGQI
jgi:hypothetical protein